MNHYAKAIAVLEKNDVNWRAVAVEVAKIAPSVLVRAEIAASLDWRQVIKPMLGDKIACIKEVRRITGMGLKEAKEAVEAEMQNGS